VELFDEVLGGAGTLGFVAGFAIGVFVGIDGFGLNRELNLARAFALAVDMPPEGADGGVGAGAEAVQPWSLGKRCCGQNCSLQP
jgi:hypothetical protein